MKDKHTNIKNKIKMLVIENSLNIATYPKIFLKMYVNQILSK